MDQSSKESLLELSKEKNPSKLAFCLKSLSNEERDEDFDEILLSALSGITKLKDKDISSEAGVIRRKSSSGHQI